MRRYPSLMERLAPALFWSLVALVFIAFVVLLLFFGGLGAMVSAVVLAAVVAAILSVLVWRAMRITRQRAFLLMMAESIERRIPLIPALQAFGTEYGGWRERARRLASALANGIPLPEALRLFPGLVPPGSLPLIEAGSKTDRLSEAMRRAAEQSDRTAPVWQALTGKILYLIVVLLCMFGMGFFMMIWIVPRFVRIYDDFSLKLPGLTKDVIELASLVHEGALVLIPLGGVLLALAVYALLCYVGVIVCDLPGTRRLTRRLDTATILDSLALTTEASQPMSEALTTLAARYPKRSVQRRLRNMWFKVAQGHDWCESLVTARLLQPGDANVLQSAVRVGNLSWALREMADSNRRRFTHRLQVALQILYPVTLCGVAVCICLYIVAFFLPLVGLLNYLAM